MSDSRAIVAKFPFRCGNCDVQGYEGDEYHNVNDANGDRIKVCLECFENHYQA